MEMEKGFGTVVVVMQQSAPNRRCSRCFGETIPPEAHVPRTTWNLEVQSLKGGVKALLTTAPQRVTNPFGAFRAHPALSAVSQQWAAPSRHSQQLVPGAASPLSLVRTNTLTTLILWHILLGSTPWMQVPSL